MGRSAKLMKRPTQKQKTLAKTISNASKPLAPPPPPPPQASEGGSAGQKRRKTLRAKAESKQK